MEIMEAISRRSSVRRFTDRVPGREIVEVLLEAAIRAPSAGNLQPWRFFVVRDGKVRKKLMAAAMGQKHVYEAPVVVVICVEPGVSARRYGDRGRDLYCIQDGAVATENLLLAAVANGLGSCWVGAFDEAAVAQAVRAPEGTRPIAMVPLGYPAGPSRQSSRIQLGRIVSYLG
ncbi:MAG: nitroreductase family protein [Gaiellales bacterium]|nr:MAG: nitroreductase family protein [Gaiellales bacterium]